MLPGRSFSGSLVRSWDGKLVEIVGEEAVSLDGAHALGLAIPYREAWLQPLSQAEARVAHLLGRTVHLRTSYTEDLENLEKLHRSIQSYSHGDHVPCCSSR